MPPDISKQNQRTQPRVGRGSVRIGRRSEGRVRPGTADRGHRLLSLVMPPAAAAALLVVPSLATNLVQCLGGSYTRALVKRLGRSGERSSLAFTSTRCPPLPRPAARSGSIRRPVRRFTAARAYGCDRVSPRTVRLVRGAGWGDGHQRAGLISTTFSRDSGQAEVRSYRLRSASRHKCKDD